MTLPRDVIDDIDRIRDEWDAPHLLRVYIAALINAGWRQTTIADVVGVSRERIRQIAIAHSGTEQSLDEYRLITGMTLPVPDAPVVETAERRGRPRRPARPETLERLRALQAAASRYRGTDANREESDLFIALVWYAHISEGASIKAIADDLGMKHGGLRARLVRHGYMMTRGQSSAYRRLTGRKPTERRPRSHCRRGHPLSGDNLRIIRTTGDPVCRACERIRYEKYRSRKRATPLGGDI